MYDAKFYLQAVVDYFDACKPELGVLDVHWSDDDANSIAIVTDSSLITMAATEYPGLGGNSASEEEGESLDTCPCCSGYIEPGEDGDDDTGHGELRQYWHCENCGAKGYARLQSEYTFAGHEIEEEGNCNA